MKKKLFSGLIALLLVLMLPTVAFAGTYNASSFAELQDIFNAAVNDSDVEIVVNLNGDITWEGFLTAVEGKTFTLRGTGTNNLYFVGFNGDGTVIVEEVNTVGGGVCAEGKVNVTVNADVDAKDGTDYGAAIIADETSKLTINGDVNADDSFVVAADGDATVAVNGTVSGTQNGIISTGNSTVTINGNVNAGDGDGIVAENNSTTTVTGDVTVFSTPLAPDAPEMTDNTLEHVGGSGVVASGNATVNVGGDVTAGDGYGINAQGGNAVDTYIDDRSGTDIDNATVNVGGNATGGNAHATEPVFPGVLPAENPSGGDGVNKTHGSTVTVGGDAKGGNGYGRRAAAGNGITLYFDINEKEGAVTVNGTAIGGTSEEQKTIGGHAIWFNIAQRAPFSGEDEFLGDYVMGELVYSAVYLHDIALNKGMSEADATALVNSYIDAVNAILANYPANRNDWTEAQGKEIFDKADAIFKSMVPGYFGPTEVYVQRLSTDTGVDLFGAGNMTPAYIAAVAASNVNYLVSLPTVAGGSFTADKTSAKEGETVMLTAKPNSGYTVDFVKINGEVISGKNGVYTFVMPRAGAEITYAFKATTQGGVPKTNDTNSAFLFIGIMALLAASAVTMKKRIEVK